MTEKEIEKMLGDAYHGGWRKSKKHAKETDFYGLNRRGVLEYFKVWFKEYINKKKK